MQAGMNNSVSQFKRKSSSKTLKSRVKTDNTTVKAFNCDLCHKSYAKKHYLDDHKRIHTGEKPYKCEICRKSFRQKYHLGTHNRIHTGGKLYICSFCPKSFKNKQFFQIHKRTHFGKGPCKLNSLQKTFAHRKNLKTHTSPSTGEKPEECSSSKKKIAKSVDCLETGEKLRKRVLLENVSSKTREKGNKSTTHKECSRSTKDEKELAITETKQRFSPRQIKNQRSENHVPKDHVANGSDASHLVLKPYGCAICDEMFSTSEEFMGHWHSTNQHMENQVSDVCELDLTPYGCGICDAVLTTNEEFLEHCNRCKNREKDAFQELFEMYLLRFSQ